MKIIATLLALLACVVPVSAQGWLMPDIQQEQFGVLGTFATNGFICTYASGTTTPLSTYTDNGLTSAAQNPIRLNSAGRPSQSSVEVSIYLTAQSYKFAIYAAGTGNTCSGTTVGTLIRTVDNYVPPTASLTPKLLDKVCHASAMTGTTPNDLSGKTVACIALLPVGGGTVDARGLEGTQAASVDMFGGTAKPVLLILGASTISVSATINVPARGGLVGQGNGTKLNASGLSGEVVRLSGDLAFVDSLWLHGPGQDPNSVDGRRGVWIGCSVLPHTTPCTPTIDNRATNLVIDAFTGNGITGEFTQASITQNLIYDTTDAGIFVTTTSSKNYIGANTVRTSRYACIDVNGPYNRVVNNFLSTCGGGASDTVAWHGILIASVSSSAPAHGNIVQGNTSQNNLGCGIALIGLVTAGTVPAYGTIIDNNVVTGHTNTSGATIFPGGICSYSGDATIISNNFSRANRDNFVISGYGESTNSGLAKVINNQSLSATRNGFYFVYTPLISLAGDFPPYHSEVRGNTDTGAAAAAFKFEPNAINWGFFNIYDNRCFSATTYCFQNTQVTILTSWDFQRNFGTGAGTAYQVGFTAAGLTVNSATPSVANRTIATTNNNAPTTYTNLTNGYQNQTIAIYIRDAGNSTFDFSANATMVGNNGSDYTSANGDVVTCTLDGTVWYCSIIQG